MTRKGLDDMGLLDQTSKKRLEGLEKILKKLIDLSQKELHNQPLTQEDHAFIQNFADELDIILEGIDMQTRKTTVIADVHTDTNTNQVLEEGVGYVNLILVAYPLSEDHLMIGIGPTLTYYEFKQPMLNRLTDEEWRKMLKTNPPQPPTWTSSFQFR
jgi:hypothetical protein